MPDDQPFDILAKYTATVTDLVGTRDKLMDAQFHLRRLANAAHMLMLGESAERCGLEGAAAAVLQHQQAVRAALHELFASDAWTALGGSRPREGI